MGEVLAMGDQPLVQVASEQWDPVGSGWWRKKWQVMQTRRLEYACTSRVCALASVLTATGGRVAQFSMWLDTCAQAQATGTSLSRVVAARERWPRRIRQAGARPQAAHCTVPLP